MQQYNWQIIHLKEIDSTNTYAKSIIKTTHQPTIIYADNQTHGRGQASNTWYSESSKNILCSIILPIQISAENIFILNCWISLVLIDILIESGIQDDKIKVKWPNDILGNNNGLKKIAGILIENIVENKNITKTIIGMGLNVNQTDFQQLSKSATSLKNLTNKEFLINSVIEVLIHAIEKYLPMLQMNLYSLIDKQYKNKLIGWNEYFMFREYGNSSINKGKIINIHLDGRIDVLLSSNALKTYSNKEIQFLI